MSYEKTKLMNLEDGQTLLGAIDGKMSDLKSAISETKADIITVADSASSAIKTFPDGADDQPMAMQIAVEPVQDLHGYDHPWPGGATKNLFPYPSFNGSGNLITKQPVNIPAGDYIIYFKRNQSNNNYVSFTFYDSNDSAVGSKTLYMSNDYSVAITLSGDAVSCTVYANASVSISEIQVEAGSTKTDYVPYSNICPISGWTGAEVTRTGKNLISGYETVYGRWIADNSLEGATLNTWTTINAGVGKSFEIPCKPNTKYYVASYAAVTFLKIGCIDFMSEINTIPCTAVTRDLNYSSGRVLEITTTANSKFLVVQTASSSITDHSAKLMLSEETFSEYEPYNGNTYSITFPSEAGTVYGGTLTINKDGTGELTVDRQAVVVNSVSQLTLYNNGVYYINDLYSSERKSIICDKLKRTDSNPNVVSSSDENYVCGMNNSGKVFVKFIRTAQNVEGSVYKFINDGNTLTISCEIENKAVYTLTCEQVKTLLGLNNLWADTGDILSVDYSADTKLYVDQITDKLTAAQRLMELIITTNREDGMTATKAYSTGDLLIVSGTLYKATTSIANGATLTVGTNVTATTVASELASLA